ncbi:MAG: DNA-directed RNA polymerase subunit D [Candidatus Pacearchaeota archaeon]|nr:DNA-directed RNA polymerase subunit D [Candidatus Pacearchaeota archaeon]
MKIEKIHESDEKLSFVLGGINFSFANTIRRSVYEIPVLAIDTVEFYKNDSALYDEILAHRLGLIPLKASKTFTSREECSCKGKGCMKCTATLKLKTKGPRTVYASDLETKGCEIVFKEMPLVFLSQDQELEFSAEAILGKATEHTKFSPGIVWFRALPEFSIKGCDKCLKCIEICPKKAIILKDDTLTIDQMKCDMCEACVELCSEHRNAISIIPSQENFIFYVESFGQKTPREIFAEALEVLNDNLKELAKVVK